MSVFAIADLHLSLGTDKPMDVFKGWTNYVDRLEQSWRLLVKPEDTVVIAGDISWAMKLEETEADLAFLHSLPGRKLLLKGNHDYWWSTKTKINNFLAEKGYTDIEIIHNSAVKIGNIGICGSRGWMYNSDSEEDKKIINREVGRIRTSIEECIKLGIEPVVFLHYPPVYDVFVCHEILNLLKEYNITECYFGHIHGAQAAKRAIQGEYDGIAMHLISCDYLNFTPILVKKE
ncbi:MAG: metallophosphoesterase [Clostridia bacterium]|nr:metallophosphoesterase [Clostridia bacterium]